MWKEAFFLAETGDWYVWKDVLTESMFLVLIFALAFGTIINSRASPSPSTLCPTLSGGSMPDCAPPLFLSFLLEYLESLEF